MAGKTYWLSEHWHLVQPRECREGRRGSQPLLPPRRGDVSMATLSYSSRGLIRGFRHGSRESGGASWPLLWLAGVEERSWGAAAKNIDTKKRRRSRETGRAKKGKKKRLAYLLELKLSTASVVRIGKQTRSEQAPDGGSVHGDGSLCGVDNVGTGDSCWRGSGDL